MGPKGFLFSKIEVVRVKMWAKWGRVEWGRSCVGPYPVEDQVCVRRKRLHLVEIKMHKNRE